MANETQLRDLLILAREGDRDAYIKFFNDVIPIIEKMARYKIFNPMDVDDIVQVSLLNIHKAINTYDMSKPVITWVRAITHYKIVDYIRKKSRQNEVEGFCYNELSVTQEGEETNITIEVYNMIELLPTDIRETLVLVKIQGFSSQEAAQQLSISEEAVRARVSRGIKKLKKLRKVDNYGQR